MKGDPAKNSESWFKKAEEDEFAAEQIIRAKQFVAPACFHCQQMAEKYLKGLLIYHQKGFHKIHDLLGLETLLLVTEPDITNFHKDLKLLTNYYF